MLPQKQKTNQIMAKVVFKSWLQTLPSQVQKKGQSRVWPRCHCTQHQKTHSRKRRGEAYGVGIANLRACPPPDRGRGTGPDGDKFRLGGTRETLGGAGATFTGSPQNLFCGVWPKGSGVPKMAMPNPCGAAHAKKETGQKLLFGRPCSVFTSRMIAILR